MSDTVKLIIEIPKVPKNDHERWVLSHGTPLDVKIANMRMKKEEILHHFQDINFYYNDCMMYADLSGMLDELIAESEEE